MAGAILICGKLCSGKSYYAEKIKSKYNAVVLSCDEVTLALGCVFDSSQFDEMLIRVKEYLLKKSAEIIAAGVNVILDWGFLTKAERNSTMNFFKRRNISCEIHYIDISDEVWHRNIAERNEAVAVGRASAYYVDEELTEKLERIFEKPAAYEVCVWIRNERENV